MKRLYKYIAMFFVGMAVLSSCADDNEIVVVEKNEVERAVVKLSFQQQADRKVINSRAAEDDEMLYHQFFHTGMKEFHYLEFLFNSKCDNDLVLEQRNGVRPCREVPFRVLRRNIYRAYNG